MSLTQTAWFLEEMAAVIATVLRGKNKSTLHRLSMDRGDNVIVINAEKVVLTGKKMTDKKYYRHTRVWRDREKTPEKILESKTTG